ncbi:MAG: hypothetical protein JNL74_04775 [Fibrobacteres bacterium]|nr:hypothetical protein [Fibrobacterota bacterium]
MPTIIIIAAAVGGLILFGLSCRPKMSSSGSGKVPSSPSPQTKATIKLMTRQQIIEHLSQLENGAAPEPKMGAMCYDMAYVNDTVVYICPKCGEKTLYPRTNKGSGVADEINFYRRELSLMGNSPEISFDLDELALCSHCTQDTANKEISLVVHYKDGFDHHCKLTSTSDLTRLRAFMQADLSYETSNDGTEALKPFLPRIKELLGTAKFNK